MNTVHEARVTLAIVTITVFYTVVVVLAVLAVHAR